MYKKAVPKMFGLHKVHDMYKFPLVFTSHWYYDVLKKQLETFSEVFPKYGLRLDHQEIPVLK